MAPASRLPPPFGSLLDRDTQVTFEFEGRRFAGYAGDTIASALAANDQWLVSRSFKYHRPRGVLTMAGHDGNTLVQLPGDPNVLGDRTSIAPGMKVSAQNVNGSLERDRDAWIEKFARFLPVGFYYKAFFRPRGAWEKWAKLIRRKAGLGVIDPAYVPDYYDKQYGFCDVAVVGAGPAGMAAALEAADTGSEVLLIDENPVLGGSLNYARLDVDGERAADKRRTLVAAIEAHPGIQVMRSAVCNAWFADNWLAVITKRRLHKIRARETILCTGAMEQLGVFRNNDLPGVMMSTAAGRLMRLYGVRPGRRAAVLAGHDDAYGVVLDLLDAGVDVRLVIELRDDPAYDDMARAVSERGVDIRTGHAVYAAEAGAGGKHLASIDVRPIRAAGACAEYGELVECDLLCMAVGYVPAYQLACQAGATLDYDDATSQFTVTNLPPGLRIAGALSGSDSASHDWPIFAHPRGKEFIDLDEDLQIADFINAIGDGYEHVELVKRYTTCGMGPSQGRLSALPAARIVAKATNKTVAETGVTTARPPFAAERLAHCAGRSFYPARRSNMHHRHVEAGAQFLHAGAWYRPAYYGHKQHRAAAILEEVRNVRENVGLVDVSTLGGIDIRGPDAAEFLNRIYTFAFVKQPVGRLRYALLTNEAGAIIDDGVACRLHEQHFYVTATTGGADRVYQSMLRWQAEWRLDVDIANVTSAYCGVNIAGPRSRSVLEPLCTDVDLSEEAFPYLGVRRGTVAGMPARLLRVGFVGELGYEIHVPQHCGEALWDALVEAGKMQGIRPFGVESQRVLRLEKGHIIIGQDTDAMSNPLEVQMSWAIARRKPFFVGARTLHELGRAPLKRQLVGFVIDDPDAPIPRESHLVLDGDEMTGRVTSCEYSPTLDKPIGLAYVPPDRASAGEEVVIKSTDGARVTARIVDLPFYDPDNRRQESLP